jgi:hypothetical protein
MDKMLMVKSMLGTAAIAVALHPAALPCLPDTVCHVEPGHVDIHQKRPTLPLLDSKQAVIYATATGQAS